MGRPAGRPSHILELFTDEEMKTSVAYNEGWRGLDARFDEPDGLCWAWFVGDPVGGDGWRFDRLGLIERLTPHLRQFVRVRQVLAAADAAADFGGRRVAALALLVDPARRPRIDAQRVTVMLGLTSSG